MNKNNIIIAIISVLILTIIIIFALKNNQKEIIAPVNQTDSDINQALNSDTTKAINENINNITIEDGTITDLTTIDQELEKL